MKFIAIAYTFAAFAAVSVVNADKSNRNLRKLLEAKPAEEGCIDGELRCACRDGTRCEFTFECSDLGVGGSCAPRQPNRATGLSCRNGEDCILGNTACEDGSACKERNGEFAEVYRNLIENDGELIEAKPASEACQNGDLKCTCRDGTRCRRTQQCVNRNSSGSCSYRRPNRNSNRSCRNGESCINNNTACRDGSACKVRNGFLSVDRNLDESEFASVESKPEDPNCKNGTWYCTCRNGSKCKTTQQCINRGSSGSCSRRAPQSNRDGNLSCRNGEDCFDLNTACADGSKCKDRSGEFLMYQ